MITPRKELSQHVADGVRRANLRESRSSESFVAPNSGGGATTKGAIFGRQAVVAVSGSTFVVLASTVDSAVQYASDGTALRQLRPRAHPRRRAIDRVRRSAIARCRRGTAGAAESRHPRTLRAGASVLSAP